MKFTPTPVRSTLLSPWGPMTLAANDTALVWVGFDGQKHEENTQAWPLDVADLRMVGGDLRLLLRPDPR